MRRMWQWRWNRKWDNINGSEWRDVIRDLDCDEAIDGVGGDSVIALRMGGSSSKTVLSTIRRDGQWLHLTGRGRWSARRSWRCGGRSF